MTTSRELLIEGMTLTGHHGVFEQERREGRLFRLDLRAQVGELRGFDSDSLHETVDYCALASKAAAIIEGNSCNLLERLAESIVQTLLDSFPLLAVDVTVRKKVSDEVAGHPDWVGVRVSRQRGE